MILRTQYPISIFRAQCMRVRSSRRQLPQFRCLASDASEEHPSWFQPLRDEMLNRPANVTTETIDKNTHDRLINALEPFLSHAKADDPQSQNVLPIGQHLIWFNPSLPPDQLLPDGTDSLHSPGGPWVRRMWAGGSIHLRPKDYRNSHTGFILGSSIVCTERIQDVELRGRGDEAKIFVNIERRFARQDILQANSSADLGGERNSPSQLAKQLESESLKKLMMRENRTLVFLKEKTSQELEAIKSGQLVPTRYMKAPSSPLFAYTLAPTPSLLATYSELTRNAHLIHLDREYARNIEGHRNLLVHGPLTLTLMLRAMASHLAQNSNADQAIDSIDYRNLAPLYCDEMMRICGARKKTSPESDTYEIWIEGPTGGLAVKGTVQVRKITRAVRNSKTSEKQDLSRAASVPLREVAPENQPPALINEQTRKKLIRRVNAARKGDEQNEARLQEPPHQPPRVRKVAYLTVRKIMPLHTSKQEAKRLKRERKRRAKSSSSESFNE